MLLNHRAKVALLTFIVPAASFCQSLGYADADTPSEAVGMMQSSVHIAQVMREQCVNRLPNLQSEIDTNLLKWKTAEASVLKKADFHWAMMVKKQPSISETLNQTTNIVKANIEAVWKMPNQAGNVVLSQYCRKHFSDLASGIWRNRTPKAYEFMDQAP